MSKDLLQSEPQTPSGYRRPILLIFLVMAVALIIKGVMDNGGLGIGPDGDDTLRLVQIRDWLSGQGWFDTHQYRLGGPEGTLMHWSRLVDLPVAGLMLFFGLFTSPEMAENLAITLWPPLTSLLVLWGVGRGAHFLGGRPAMNIALFLSALYILMHSRFLPGALDHHNLQLGLVAIAISYCLDPNRHVRSWVISGLALAFSVAIGAEIYLIVGVIILWVVLLWIVKGPPMRRQTRGFAAALALAIAALFFATNGPSQYGSEFCDSFTAPIAAFLLFGTVGLLGLIAINPKTWLMRGLAAVGLGAAFLVFVKVYAPQCLGNPLDQLDPLVHEFWLSKVQEAVGAMEEFGNSPSFIPRALMIPLTALAVCFWKIAKTQQKWPYGLLAAILILNLAMTFYQVRFWVFGNMVGIIPLAVVAAGLRARSHETKTSQDQLKFFGFMALCLPVVWSLLILFAEQTFGWFPSQGSAAAAAADEGEDEDDTLAMACDSDDVMASLNRLEPGRFAAEINASIPILGRTHHSVLVGNYHRGSKDILSQIKAFSALPQDGLARLNNLGVDYVLVCETDGAWEHMRRDYPEGFWAQLFDKGSVPGLTRLPTAEAHEAIRVYQLR